MLKTLLHYRNPDSTLDLITMLSEFFKKGVVTGGEVLPVTPNSIPQVTVAPFKLIGQDGMVVLETASTITLTLPTNQTLVVCFQSQYVSNDNPVASYEVFEISAFNALSQAVKDTLTIFATVTTGIATDAPVVSYDLRDVIDPVSRNTLRGKVAAVANLPAINNRLGDAYIVESGIPDPDNGMYVWKGIAGWVNITDALSVSSLLAQHRSNLFADEIHMTNAQADAALGSFGSPSAANPYVTSTDPRLPTQAENDALVGLSQTVPVPPSSTNPYVTSAYNLAEPSEVVLSGVGAFITLNAASGPFFVGLGATAVSALPFFGIFDDLLKREYLNSLGQGIILTGVFKDLLGPTPLNPSSETSVVNSNGFWNQTLYLGFTGTIDSDILVRYGKQINFANVSRGFALKPGPEDAQTSAEVLERLADISGRLMDDPMQTGESNVELFATQKSLRRYLNTTTTSDLVIPCTDFPHLRSVSDIAADFAAVYGDIQMFGASLANYTVKWSNTDVAAFDNSVAQDTPNVAVITYAAGPALPAIVPGWMFVDDLGAMFRILAFDGNRSILIYTGGAPVNSNNANGNQSHILKANNPRRIEILVDHETSMYREFFPVDDIKGIPGQFEILPPGGVTNGAFVPVNNFSLIGTSILPNTGSAVGAGRGRPEYSIVPVNTGNRVEQRLILIGDWESDQANHPRQALGNVTQGSLGIEYTGRLSELTLWTAVKSNMSYGFRVFIDGVYTHSASQFLTDANIGVGLPPSSALASLRGNVEKAMMPIRFNALGLADNLVHTVRIEVTRAVASFPLYGIEVFYNGAIESQGRAFTSTDYIKTLTDSTFTPASSAQRGQRVIRFLDRTLQTRQSVSSQMPIVSSLTVAATAVATNISDANLSQNCLMGDVILFTDRSTTQSDATNYAYRRVAGIDRFNGTVTIDSPLGFVLPNGGFSRAELVFRVPTAPNGLAVPSAPRADTSSEYARFSMSDWSVDMSRDVANLGTVAAESRVTVLDDGSTSLSVVDCRQVTTGIEGFSNGVRLEATTAVMTVNGWGTRMDVVFSGSSGTPSTVQIEVDGLYTYTITLPNDGLLRHSLFYTGVPQSHTVRIFNPSVAAVVVVSQWIFHDITPPVANGTVLSEYTIPRNATPASSNYYDFAPTSSINPCVVSNAGVRIFDITKYGARIYEGTTGSLNWTMNIDYVNNPRFAYGVHTDRSGAIMEIQSVGPHLELYYLAGPDRGITQFFLDGVVASSANYPGQIFGTGYVSGTGQVDMYSASVQVRRLVMTNLSQATHTLRLQNTNTKNGSSSGFFLYPVAAAENSGTAVLNRRGNDDQQINRLHMQSFRDLRQFLTLTPAQIGVVTPEEDQVPSNGLTLGYISSAYGMSDNSGTSQNMTISVVGAVTVADIVWPWTFAVTPGLTTGDLEVLVDGKILPRFVSGVTVDAYYKEDAVITGRITFYANLSGSPLSIEVRRKAGTIDSNTTNTGRISTQAGIVVGNSGQVIAGLADYSSLVLAVAAAASGGKITVLPGFLATESVLLNKRLTIVGQGFDSQINGTFTLQSGSLYSTVRGLQVTQVILQAGAAGNQVLDCFWTNDPIDPNPVGTNRLTGMKL